MNWWDQMPWSLFFECVVKATFFSRSHVWMWELDHKESWALKNWCFWTVVLEKTLESPLNCKEIKPVNPKGDQPWIFIGKTDAEAEGPILWPPDAKKWLIGRDPDVGKEWRQEEKGMTEVKVVGWHHELQGHEFEQAPGVGDGQGSLACCSPWGRKKSNMTYQLNWTEQLVINLFTCSVSSWISLGNLCVSRNLSISSRLSYLLAYLICCSSYSLYFCKVYSNVFISFLILMICAFSLFFLCQFFVLVKFFSIFF